MRTPMLAFAALSVAVTPAPADAETVTFTKHVAPILWAHCAGCHHKGAVGPFPLLTYADAAKRAKFIRDITANRRMPPWRAAPGHAEFSNERRLNEAEIRTLAEWVAAGAPEGDAKDLGTPPKFSEDWQLGTPDLVLKMPADFKVPATGPDVYRCFVIPIPGADEERYVSAVEFRAGNGRAIHHAGFFLDDKGEGRKRERETKDGQPGYSSFGGPGFSPAGSLGGWSLAALPRFLPADTAMIVPKGSEMVLQIHYHPTGKEEIDRSELGIYFAKKPASKFVTTFISRTTDIAIPAGDKRHQVKCESAPLPADVRVVAVSPHMHFLGREIAATAVLPGGKELPLVVIKDWDFHWHERYLFKDPPRLPKGTVVRVEGVYDNSAGNPKNPNKPPKLVKYGNNLTDEMISAHLEVVAESRADLEAVRKMRGAR